MMIRLSVLLALFMISLPLHAATVSGSVVWTDEDGEPDRSPRLVRRQEAGCAVYLIPKDEALKEQLAERPLVVPRVDQFGKEFVPRLQVVQKGSKVQFGNGDSVFHNVYSNDPEFNLGRYPKGYFREQEFNEEGITHLFCDIHPRMHAVILVVDSPLYAVVSTEWTFEISDVPDGDYELLLWHMQEGEHRMDVTIAGDSEITVKPVLGANDNVNRPRRAGPSVPPGGE